MNMTASCLRAALAAALLAVGLSATVSVDAQSAHRRAQRIEQQAKAPVRHAAPRAKATAKASAAKAKSAKTASAKTASAKTASAKSRGKTATAKAGSAPRQKYQPRDRAVRAKGPAGRRVVSRRAPSQTIRAAAPNIIGTDDIEIESPLLPTANLASIPVRRSAVDDILRMDEHATYTKASDTTHLLFVRLGIVDADVETYVRQRPEAAALRFFGNGREVRARVDKLGHLQSIRMVTDVEWTQTNSIAEILTLSRTDKGLVLKTEKVEIPFEGRSLEIVNLTVTSTLARAAEQSRLPREIALQLPYAFEGVNTAKGFSAGDRVRLVYEKLEADGLDAGAGRLLAFRSTHHGQSRDLFLFQSDDGRGAFYSADGSSSSLVFEWPLKEGTYSQSSPFAPLRRNPVTRRLRPHQGTDLSAKRGTPIYAAADGRVLMRERYAGYGLVIDLLHAGSTTTRYAHMSQFEPGISVGDKVHRGQLIGYVGSTGRATGAHLHFEVHVDGVPVNPDGFRTTKTESVFLGEVASFRKTVQDMSRLLGSS